MADLALWLGAVVVAVMCLYVLLRRRETPAAGGPIPTTAARIEAGRATNPQDGLFDAAIRYRKSGALSEHRVTVFKIGQHEIDGQAGGNIYVYTWNHETGGKQTFLLDAIDDAWDPTTGEVAPYPPQAWLLARAGSELPPPPPRPWSTKFQPPVAVRLVFKGRRRGTREVDGLLNSASFVGREATDASILIQNDPTGAEDDVRKLTLAPPGRNGVLLALREAADPTFTAPPDVVLLRLANRQHG